VLVYELFPDDWFGLACDAAGRNMTADEWSEFGPRDLGQVQTCPQWPAEIAKEGDTNE
jgi:hypothetical protein